MVAFNQIPNGIRVPFVYVEFDASKAQQGASIQEYKALAIGQKLATGTQAAEELVLVTSADEAGEKFGRGSMLHGMLEKYFQANKVNEVRVVALDDLVAGVQATGSIDFAGPATEAGTLNVYIGGRRYQVAVADADTDTVIAAALVAEIQADTDRQVDSAVNGVDDTIVDLTARHKGTLGNEIDIRLNYESSDKTPAGVSAVITAMSGGTGDPDVADAIAVLTEDQFNVVMHPWTDSANLSAIETEMEDRWGPIRQNDGHLFAAKRDTVSNLSTLGNSRNSKHLTVMGISGPDSPWQWVGSIGGIVALYGQQDPGRPFQTLELPGIQAPADSELFTLSERDILLGDGISTFKKTSGGLVVIERLRTTQKTNAFGATDLSLADVNPKLTLSFLRYDFRTIFLTKFPRHKLAGDSFRAVPGQAVLTPKAARAEAIAIFRRWEEDLALVENIEQFKRDLIVERDSEDPNRLNFLLPPDLINQLRVVGVKIEFLL